MDSLTWTKCSRQYRDGNTRYHDSNFEYIKKVSMMFPDMTEYLEHGCGCDE